MEWPPSRVPILTLKAEICRYGKFNCKRSLHGHQKMIKNDQQKTPRLSSFFLPVFACFRLFSHFSARFLTLFRTPENKNKFLCPLRGDPVQNHPQNPATANCLVYTRKSRSEVLGGGIFVKHPTSCNPDIHDGMPPWLKLHPHKKEEQHQRVPLSHQRLPSS